MTTGKRAGLCALPYWAVLDAILAMAPEERPALLADLGVDQVEALLEPVMLGTDRVARDQVIARYAELRPRLGKLAADAAARRDMGTVPLCSDVRELFGKVKVIEQPDGSWNGGEIVQLLCEWFTEHGLDPDRPVNEQPR